METQERGINASLDNPEVSASEATGYKQELKRVLTVKDLVIFGLIIMLPIAPIQVYGVIAPAVMGMTPLVYLVGIIAMVFTAISYARMSSEFPIAGSIYSFIQRGFNPHIAFVIGWTVIIDYILVPALLCGFGGLWLNSIIPAVPTYIFVLCFLALNTFINVRGVQVTAKASTTILILQFVCIVLFLIFGIKYVFINGLGVGGFSLAPFYQAGQINFQFIASATSIAVFGFLGFDCISTLSEEVKNPKRSIGIATIMSLILIGIVFIMQSYMASLIHPDYTNLDMNMAFFDIAKEAGGAFMYYTFLLVAIIAVGIANALAIQSSAARLLFALARDNTIPGSGFLAKIHPKFKTPANALYIVAIITVFVAILPTTNIMRLVNFGALTAFLFINITVFVHFYIKKKNRGVIGFLKYFVTPAIGFLVILYVWLGLGTATYILGFSWMAIGIIIGAVKSKGYKEVPPVLREE